MKQSDLVQTARKNLEPHPSWFLPTIACVLLAVALILNF